MGGDLSKAVEPSSTNCAFLFIKPHALTEPVKELVSSTLTEGGFTIVEEGRIDGSVIEERKLIDQHYYAIASKATILKSAALNVPAAKFKEKFGLEWSAALTQGLVFNAMDACKKLDLDSAQISTLWNKAKDDDNLIKFGVGFYCGKLDTSQGDLYVLNAFFMFMKAHLHLLTMRSKFVEPGAAIYYYVVSWDASKTSWEDFRGKVIGPTDPANAPKGSLRKAIYERWKKLGLPKEPNVSDNGVHVSASPFEALAERMNWLGKDVAQDPYGSYLLQKGLSKSVITEWSVDPAIPMPDGSKASIFDTLEDMDAEPLAEKALTLMPSPGMFAMEWHLFEN